MMSLNNSTVYKQYMHLYRCDERQFEELLLNVQYSKSSECLVFLFFNSSVKDHH